VTHLRAELEALKLAMARARAAEIEVVVVNSPLDGLDPFRLTAEEIAALPGGRIEILPGPQAEPSP
jgi:hypothetical protein